MQTEYLYFDGRIVPWDEARIHVASTGAKYGANVFEGICGYEGDEQYLFRLPEHLRRMHDSVRLMRIARDYPDDEYTRAVRETLQANEIRGDAHVRMSVIIVGEGLYDVSEPAVLVCTATPRTPSTLAERAVGIGISSFRRIDDLAMPPRIKAGPNYHNGRFALMEAARHGHDEALLLNQGGMVAESTNSCFMMVRHGALVTPPVSAGLLESVTRDTLLRLAAEVLAMPLEVRDIDRSEACAADEAMLCNSFQEVRPIRSIDGISLPGGAPGPVTTRLWDAYESVVRGRDDRYAEWLTAVDR